MQLVRRVLPLSAEEVLSRISDYDIYKYECPEFTLGTLLCNWMRGEKTPSMCIFMGEDGKMHHYDQGDNNYRGDCWDLVRQKYGIDPRQAIDHVAKVFMLFSSNTEQYKSITNQYVKPLMEQSRHCLIHVAAKKWEIHEIAYWAQYGIEIQELKAEQIYPVGEYSINRQRQYIAPGELCFAYKYENGFKIYMPNKPKEEKWKSNVSTSLVENTQVIEENDQIIITKAKKCRMCLSQLHPGVINVQNETRSGFSSELIERLRGKQVYVQYDSDAAGKKNSMLLTKELGYKHLNVPDHMLQYGVKDYSDWIKLDGNNKRVKDHLRQKGLI